MLAVEPRPTTPCDMPFRATLSGDFTSATEAEAGCKRNGYDVLCDKAAVILANRNLCTAGWTSGSGAGWWWRDVSPGGACGKAQAWNKWGVSATICNDKSKP